MNGEWLTQFSPLFRSRKINQLPSDPHPQDRPMKRIANNRTSWIDTVVGFWPIFPRMFIPTVGILQNWTVFEAAVLRRFFASYKACFPRLRPLTVPFFSTWAVALLASSVYLTSPSISTSIVSFVCREGREQRKEKKKCSEAKWFAIFLLNNHVNQS